MYVHYSCGGLQGFLALRKTVIEQGYKSCNNFTATDIDDVMFDFMFDPLTVLKFVGV